MTPPPLDPRQQRILRALDDAGSAQDLNGLRQLLQRQARAEELMPLVGGLVVAGYLQKITGTSSAARSPDRSYHPVQFSLTDQGRAQIQGRPAARRPDLAASGRLPPAGTRDDDQDL